MSDELSLLIFPGRQVEERLPDLLDGLTPSVKRLSPTVHVVSDHGAPPWAPLLAARPPFELMVVKAHSETARLNEALARVRSEHVALLSTDVLPMPEWLDELEATARAHGEAAFVASSIELGYSRGVLHSAGVDWQLQDSAVHRGFRKRRSAYARREAVLAPSRLACLVRRSSLQRSGFWDETMETLHGDADLGIRLLLHGQGGWLAPDASALWTAPPPCLHEASEIWTRRQRDRLALLYKTLPFALWLRFLPPYLVGQLSLFRHAWRRRQLLSLLRARGRFWCDHPSLSHGRKRLLYDPAMRFDLLETYLATGRLPAAD